MKTLNYLIIISISLFLINSCVTINKKQLQQAEHGKYNLVTVAELKTLINTGMDVLIIDNLPQKNFKKGHIPGARNFPFPNPEMLEWDTSKTKGKGKEDFISLLGPDKDKPLIFYCWDTE